MNANTAHVYRWFRHLLEFTIPLKKVDDIAYLRRIVRLQLHSRPPLKGLASEATFSDTDQAIVELATAVLRRAADDLRDVPPVVAGHWIASELLSSELGLIARSTAERLDPKAIGIRAAAGHPPPVVGSPAAAPRLNPEALARKNLVESFEALPEPSAVNNIHLNAILRAGSRNMRAMLDRVETPLQQAWLGMVTARSRHLQERGVDSQALHQMFPGLTAFAREQQPGWVAGLKRDGGPTHGSKWVDEARHWDEIVRLRLAAEQKGDGLVVTAGEPNFRPLAGLSALLGEVDDGPSAPGTSSGQVEIHEMAAVETSKLEFEANVESTSTSESSEVESRATSPDEEVAATSEASPDGAPNERGIDSTDEAIHEPLGAGAPATAVAQKQSPHEAAPSAPDEGDEAEEGAAPSVPSQIPPLTRLYRAHVLSKERRSLDLAQSAFQEAEDAIGELLESTPDSESVSRTLHRVTAALQASTALPSDLAAVRNRAEAVPTPRDLGEEIAALDIEDAYDALAGADVSYEGLLQTCRILHECSDDSSAPAWLVGHVAHETDPLKVFLVLAGDPVARASLRECLDWVGELQSEEVELLAEPVGADVAPTSVALAAELQSRTQSVAQQREIEGRVADLFDGALVQETVDRLGRASGMSELARLAADLEDISGGLRGASIPLDRELEQLVRSQGLGARSSLDAAQEAVSAARKSRILGLALSAVNTLQELEEILMEATDAVSFSEMLEPDDAYTIHLSHATSGTRGVITPRVSYVPARSGHGDSLEAGLGHVELPVRVSIVPPPNKPLHLCFSCPQMSGRVPGDLLAERTLVPISPHDNAADAGDYEVVLTLPATQILDPSRPGAVKELELTGQLLETDGNAIAEAPRSVHYRDIVHVDQAINTYLNPLQRDSVEPDEVWEHPIGIQRGIVKVRDHMRRQQQSFFAAAPRRFGKTMMIRALEDQLEDEPGVVIIALTASNDRVRFWAEVESALRDRFSCSASHKVGARQQVLPLRGESCTFENVRSKAAGRGIQTVWFLVDEAQRLFTGADSMDFGNSLKDRLDTDLTMSDEHRAAIRFGFFGLSHLRKRMGANFRGALADWSVSEIYPEDLEKLLRTDSKEGLQTSKKARRELARQAENFWILRELLMVAEDYLSRKQRSWLVGPDVSHLVDELFDNEDKLGDVWNYVRDPLNDHEDINYWQPSPAYPVALALAQAQSRGLRGRDSRAEVDRILRIWAGKTVLEREVGRQILDLQARNLLQADSLAFRTDLTRRVLARRAGTGPNASEPAVEELLNRLTVGTVKVPLSDDLTHLGGGRQAEVLLGRDDLVYRVEHIRDPGSRKNFLKTCEVYRRLKDSLTESGDVRYHFPDIVDWGFAHDTEDGEGVLVYRFVAGTALTRGCLKPKAAAWAGYCLSRAVHHLSKVGIIHRDLKPENILFQAGGVAAGKLVLVDFGLSRVIDIAVSPTSTTGASAGYLPPEVATDGPSAWSHTGDLYSLGRTLATVLDSTDGVPDGLHHAIEQLQATEPSRRGTPAGAEELFQELLTDQDLQVGKARDEAKSRYQELLVGLPRNFADVAGKFEENFIAIQLGVVLGWKRKMMDAALLINDLFESFVEQRLGPTRREGNSLAAARHLRAEDPIFAPFDSSDARLVGLVRTAAAHHDWNSKFDEAMVRVDGDGGHIEQAIYAVADVLDGSFKGSTTEVRDLARAFLAS